MVKKRKPAKHVSNDVDDEFEELLQELNTAFYTAEDEVKEDVIQRVENLIRKLKHQVQEDLTEKEDYETYLGENLEEDDY